MEINISGGRIYFRTTKPGSGTCWTHISGQNYHFDKLIMIPKLVMLSGKTRRVSSQITVVMSGKSQVGVKLERLKSDYLFCHIF